MKWLKNKTAKQKSSSRVFRAQTDACSSLVLSDQKVKILNKQRHVAKKMRNWSQRMKLQLIDWSIGFISSAELSQTELSNKKDYKPQRAFLTSAKGLIDKITNQLIKQSLWGFCISSCILHHLHSLTFDPDAWPPISFTHKHSFFYSLTLTNPWTFFLISYDRN